MKSIRAFRTHMYTFAATTAVWAAVVYAAVYFHKIVVLTESQAMEIYGQFMQQEQMLQSVYHALQLCQGT